jgi:hypothetical protein
MWRSFLKTLDFICGEPANGEKICLDHHHGGRIRGWCHNKCNIALMHWIEHKYEHHPNNKVLQQIFKIPRIEKAFFHPPAEVLYESGFKLPLQTL